MRLRSAGPVSIWVTSARQSSSTRKHTVTQWCVIMWGTELAAACTKTRRYPTIGKPGQGPKIKAGYVFAVEPMINLGTHHTKVLADGWTVVTLDGKPSAHAEHTIAITEEGPEVLTRIGSPAVPEAVAASSVSTPG